MPRIMTPAILSVTTGVPLIMQKPPLVGEEGTADMDWENGLKTAYASLSQFIEYDELETPDDDALAAFWYAKVRLRSDALSDTDPLPNTGNRLSGRVTRLFVVTPTISLAVVRTRIGWMVATTANLEIVDP